MTIQTLLIIVVCFWVAILAIGVLVLTYIGGKISVRDNPKQALVFVKTGLHISRPFTAKLSETASQGSSFKYKDKVIMIPKQYGELYHRSKRMVFISGVGQLIASPFTTDVALCSTEREDLIYELCSGHIGADGMRAMKGKSAANIILIAAIAFIIGVCAVIGYNYITPMLQQKTTPPAIQQPKLTNPSIVEVK